MLCGLPGFCFVCCFVCVCCGLWSFFVGVEVFFVFCGFWFFEVVWECCLCFGGWGLFFVFGGLGIPQLWAIFATVVDGGGFLSWWGFGEVAVVDDCCHSC